LVENPSVAEIDGRLECIHFLVHPVKLLAKLDASSAEHVDSAKKSSHLFVAFRLHNVNEFHGNVSHTLSQNSANGANWSHWTNIMKRCTSLTHTKTILRSLRLFSDRELYTCLKAPATTKRQPIHSFYGELA
jgi:hypothetical protein